MKQTFDEFITLVEKRIERDPWVRDANIQGFCTGIENEAKELAEAWKTNDPTLIKEEIGDIIMNAVLLCRLAEEQQLFTFKDVLVAANEKMKRRCPFILDTEHKPLTIKEAVRIWKEAKKKEKEEKLLKSQTLK